MQRVIIGMLVTVGLAFVCLAVTAQEENASQEKTSQGKTSIDDTRPTIAGVGVDEHLGEKINLDLTFRNRKGETVRLGDLINGDMPVVIAPVYYQCPNLCTLVLNGVSDLIDRLDLVLGKEYRVINISVDPENTPQLATDKARNYTAAMRFEGKSAAENWYWLTGAQTAITEVMNQIGFRYKKVDDQFSHTSVIVLISPDGMISRYVYGVVYPAKDVRLALIDASAGKIGNTLDRVLIYCFKFDPKAGKYVPYAQNIMRLGGALTLVFMTIAGFFLWRVEMFNRRRL